MVSAAEFLKSSVKASEDAAKDFRFYLFSLTQGIDTSFILDLNRIKVNLLPWGVVLKESLDLLKFLVSNPEEKDINEVMQSYLRLEKSKEFVKSALWSFLFSLETLKDQHEEFWMITNILSSSRTPKSLISFYMFCRQVICSTAGKEELILLDDFSLTFAQLNLVMGQIFGDKVSSKIFLIKNFREGTRCSSFLSYILLDWIANSKTFARGDQKSKTKIATSKSPQPLPSRALNSTATQTLGTSRSNVEITKNSQPPIKIRHVPSASPIRVVSQNTTRDTSTKSARTQQKSTPPQSGRSEALTKEMMYLINNQEETQGRIEKIRTVNADLVKEYNSMYDKGKLIYNQYFEIYYALKLELKNRYIKFPVSDEELEIVKSFQNFQKLALSPLRKPKESPMRGIF